MQGKLEHNLKFIGFLILTVSYMYVNTTKLNFVEIQLKPFKVTMIIMQNFSNSRIPQTLV